MEEISAAIDNKMSTIGVFIDLKKAFDTINHSILIDKLEHYGVRGTAKKWIMNYLSGRQQYVHIDNVHSGFKKSDTWYSSGINTRTKIIYYLY